jgi:FdhD protein
MLNNSELLTPRGAPTPKTATATTPKTVSIHTRGALASIEHDGYSDEVAVEEPLEIRHAGEPLAITMRTPGHDEELAAGFLYGEGLIDADTLPEIGPTDDLAANTVEIRCALAKQPATRRFYMTSSCGVCGRGALTEVAAAAPPAPPGPSVPRALLAGLPERLEQPGFERTGGLHATGIFDAAGRLELVREDVGRHNAFDKAVGHELLAGRLPLGERIVCVSGRLCFELVQKAALAGAPILVGVGAPTSLAISLAAEQRITLCGFARGGRVNVYTGAERVA